jgi:hypothetical protein
MCAEHIRCIYCERQGITIVHPAVRTFHGRDRVWQSVAWERLFTRSDIRNYTNHALFLFASNAPNRLDGILADDFIYCDYVLDPNAREIDFPFMFFYARDVADKLWLHLLCLAADANNRATDKLVVVSARRV